MGQICQNGKKRLLERKNRSGQEKLINKLHFWAGPTVQGWIEGVSLIWQYSKNSRPQGGPKLAKTSLKNALS